MLKLNRVLAVVALFALLAIPACALDLKTETGRFILGAVDNMNLNPDGSLKPVAGQTGSYYYDLLIAAENGDAVREIRYPKPQASNVIIMLVTGDAALVDEGVYDLGVKIVNVLNEGTAGEQSFAKPLEITHALTFEKPVPPTPIPTLTPTPTPVPPTPTPTPIPPQFPDAFFSDDQFFFIDETGFNETNFRAISGSELLEYIGVKRVN